MSREPHPLWSPVRAILLEDWDPIGVHGAGPADEYDAYAWRVISMLSAGASDGEIAAYLHGVARDNMGFPQSDEESLTVAVKLNALEAAHG